MSTYDIMVQLGEETYDGTVLWKQLNFTSFANDNQESAIDFFDECCHETQFPHYIHGEWKTVEQNSFSFRAKNGKYHYLVILVEPVNLNFCMSKPFISIQANYLQTSNPSC